MNKQHVKIKQVKITDPNQWPSKVNILGAGDMLEGKLSDKTRKKHCLVGHCVVNFKKFGNVLKDDNYDTVVKAIIKAGVFLTNNAGYPDKGDKTSLIFWNDVICQDLASSLNLSPNALRARIWNLGMALLGYTEGNPEAKYVK